MNGKAIFYCTSDEFVCCNLSNMPVFAANNYMTQIYLEKLSLKV